MPKVDTELVYVTGLHMSIITLKVERSWILIIWSFNINSRSIISKTTECKLKIKICQH